MTTTESEAPYIPATRWTGVREGYVYTVGDLGVGYYKEAGFDGSAQSEEEGE